MYTINDCGKKRDKYVKRETLKMLVLGPVISLILIILSYISMSESPAFFWAVSSLLILISIFLFIYAPLMMLKRHVQTIKSIDFGERHLVIETFPGLRKKQKIIKLKKGDFNVIKRRFTGYGKPDKEGIILKMIRPYKEFYLLKDYFTEYEEIEKNIFSLC